MAIFDENKLISALTINKAEIGKKYFMSDVMKHLKQYVEADDDSTVQILNRINKNSPLPFIMHTGRPYQFLYPYEEPQKQRMIDKTNDAMARRVEERLNGLEVIAANLMQNIAYARSELLKKADEYEEKITANKTTLYLINGYTKEVGVWDVELFRDRQEATERFKHYVESYNAELDDDDPNSAICPNDEGGFWLEERII